MDPCRSGKAYDSSCLGAFAFCRVDATAVVPNGWLFPLESDFDRTGYHPMEAKNPWLDGLAIILLIARIAQSVLHIGPTQTELVAGARSPSDTKNEAVKRTFALHRSLVEPRSVKLEDEIAGRLIAHVAHAVRFSGRIKDRPARPHPLA